MSDGDYLQRLVGRAAGRSGAVELNTAIAPDLATVAAVFPEPTPAPLLRKTHPV